MARVRDPELWQAWRERLRRFRGSLETVVDFCRRERVSVAAFYQWRRKLSPNGDQPAMSGESDHQSTTARQSSLSRRSPPQFLELVVPTRPAALAANSDGESPVSAGCVEVRLPNGTCVRLDSGDLAALRTAILAAAEIGDVAGAGGVSC
jgi:hypothetical protein